MLGNLFNAVALPTNYYVALVDSTTAPATTTNTKSDLTEVPNGNGYTTGGISLSKNTTDFPTITEVDGSNKATIRIKDLVWTASSGNLPGSGTGARYGVLTDDNATQGSRVVYCSFDLTSNRVVSVGQTLTLQACEIDLVTSGTV